MIVLFKSKKLEDNCSSIARAKRVYGDIRAAKIFQRIQEIKSASSIDVLVLNRIGRCHALTQNRAGQYAMDLGHPYRLIFEAVIADDNEAVCVIEIADYHGS